MRGYDDSLDDRYQRDEDRPCACGNPADRVEHWCARCGGCDACCEGHPQVECPGCGNAVEPDAVLPCGNCETCCPEDHLHLGGVVLDGRTVCSYCATRPGDVPDTTFPPEAFEGRQCARCHRIYYFKFGWRNRVTAEEIATALDEVERDLHRLLKIYGKPELPKDFIQRVRKPARKPER